jgi:putative peptidoglycan binding protein
MKSTILCSALVGALALALATAGAEAAPDRNKRQARAKPQQRSAHVQAARPANTGRSMASQRNVSAAQHRQRSFTQPRNSSATSRVNRSASATRAKAARPAQTTTATRNTIRQRNLARNERMRERNAQRKTASRTSATARERRDAVVNRNRNAAVNRNRDVAVNRNTNADLNRNRNANNRRATSTISATARERNMARNTNQFRNRNNVAINRNRNFNRNQNAAFYRGRNARVTNNWRGDAFHGQRYWAFRNYNRQWHDRSWWRNHYTRIIFVNNGWWYWNAGYWFPAWGYAPSVSYVYDGPIYAYNGLTPDQVTVNVQEALAAAGYYDGLIDGVLGPMTREAIANYQADNGLAVTSAIDEPTLATMGLV